MSKAILVLSGGQSKRMKQDKSQLMYRGQRLLDWQVQRFQASNYPVVSHIEDRFEGHLGPLAGIDAALNLNKSVQHWVVVPVDMPKLPVKWIARLFNEGRMTKVPCAYDRAPLPLYVYNSAAVRDILNAWLANPEGKRSVFAFVTALSGQWLPATGTGQELENYNTPEQWQRALAED